jgi:hypothetical protein
MRSLRVAASIAFIFGSLCLSELGIAQGLQVTYGSRGVQTLSYNGTLLEDVGANGSDAFHIWHMKMTDLSGNAASCAECGWGESNMGRNWNGATNTMTYSFSWGLISVQFAQAGNSLNMNVSVTNQANSGYIFDGATIYPFVLNFAQLPAGFIDPSYSQLGYETIGPGVVNADFGVGEVVSVDTNASKPLYSGFQPAGHGFAYTPIISGTTPDGLAAFLPHFDRPVLPGQTDSFTVSLRFAPSGTPTGNLAQDAYQNWAQTWPAQLNWSDRRAIGTVYLASSPQGNVSQPGGYPNNPRRYFNDSNAQDFDVTTVAGLAAFQKKILQQAASQVTNLQNLNAQGVVTWDIEGEQYPQSTSYVCSPDEIAQVAPEMESVITDRTSPYFNMKLDDAYFLIMRSAGFRVGVCVRPQHFTLNADGTAQQVYLPDASVEAEMLRKMQYAHNRWGATLFYVDSSVEIDGAVLDASIFQQLQAALPDSLIMPEESTPKHYAYTAPFQSFIDLGATGTDAAVYNYYPKAFSAILVNDAAASTLAASQAKLTASVKNGDVLMTHVDYWQANDPTIVQIYQNAGQSAQPAPVPVPVAPPATPVTILSPAAGATISGAVSVVGQLNVTVGTGGSQLVVDGSPVGGVVGGQGPFSYPLDSTLLNNGPHTIQISVDDTSSNVDLSAPVSVIVSNVTVPAPPAPPPVVSVPVAPSPTTNSGVAITLPSSGATLAGVVQVLAQVSVPLDAAGSYLMVDGNEIGTQRVSQGPFQYALDTTTLSDGSHTLQIWAHDIGNNTDLSATLPVTVANGAAAPVQPVTPVTPTQPTPTQPTQTVVPTQPAAPVASAYPISLDYPVSGQGVFGVVEVTATIPQTLDAAGSYLMLDGSEVGTRRIGAAPYIYGIDTASLTPGQHTLQIWAHDTNNDTLLSNPVQVTTSGN